MHDWLSVCLPVLSTVSCLTWQLCHQSLGPSPTLCPAAPVSAVPGLTSCWCGMQEVAFDNNNITGTFPSIYAPRVQSLPTGGLGFT